MSDREPTEPVILTYSEADLLKWWPAVCPACGWRGLSRDCAGGHPIADTGDYSEVVCPECLKKEEWIEVQDDEDYEAIPAGK